MKYDYYTIEVPSDITGPEERASIAIAEAREAAKVYAVPAEWKVLSDDGTTVRVRRRRKA